jgi:hypothetical protein
MTAALVPYYEGQGLLRHVDGVGSPSDVGQRVRRAIQELTGLSDAAKGAAPGAVSRGGANET